MIVYALLFLLWLAIWLPLRRPTIRWEMHIYGTSIMYRQHMISPEARHWERLRIEWRARDVT